jgi:hypothetical protein
MIRVILVGMIVSCLAGCGKDVSSPSEAKPSSIEFADWLAQAQVAQLVREQKTDALPKSNRPSQPIQPEKLQKIQPSMTEKEIIELLGNPLMTTTKTFDGSTTQVLFYCLIALNQPAERKIRLGSEPPAVETCSAPIVTENGVVVGLGWVFFREYTKIHPNLWDQEFEKYFAVICSSWEKSNP